MTMIASYGCYNQPIGVYPVVADDDARSSGIMASFGTGNQLGYSSESNSNMNGFSGVFPSFKYMMKLQLETCIVNLIIT